MTPEECIETKECQEQTSRFRDRLLVGLIVLTMTNGGWFLFWLRDVPTWLELEARPPILRMIPELRSAVARAEKTETILGDIKVAQAELKSSNQNLTEATKALQHTVQELTKEINLIRIELAKAARR